MNPYNPNTGCIKCGYRKASTVYDKFLGGLILRTCSRCGYVWHEATLDKPSLLNNEVSREGKSE